MVAKHGRGKAVQTRGVAHTNPCHGISCHAKAAKATSILVAGSSKAIQLTCRTAGDGHVQALTQTWPAADTGEAVAVVESSSRVGRIE